MRSITNFLSNLVRGRPEARPELPGSTREKQMKSARAAAYALHPEIPENRPRDQFGSPLPTPMEIAEHAAMSRAQRDEAERKRGADAQLRRKHIYDQIQYNGHSGEQSL